MKWCKRGYLLAAMLAFASATIQAADVTITVNGKVVAKPCTVSTTNATVDLGDLYSFSLMSAGAASAWHDVALELLIVRWERRGSLPASAGQPTVLDIIKTRGPRKTSS